jgi:hypothetical protein
MPTPPPAAGRVVYLVVCAAPPARRIEELVEALHQRRWRVCLIPTPTAAAAAGGWVDAADLADRTGLPVRSQPRHPDDPKGLPTASAVLAVPATFNTINKWAAGISDTFALGVLNEALGLPIPVIASPYAKPALTTHPAYHRSLQTLRDAGVHLTGNEALRPADQDQPFRWDIVIDAITRHTPPPG